MNAVKRKEVGTRRWHFKYGNNCVTESVRAAQLDNRTLSPGECQDIRTKGILRWRHLSQAEQNAFKARFDRGGDTGAEDADDESSTLRGFAVASEGRSPWQKRLGSDDWPVDSAHLESALLNLSGSESCGGVYNKFMGIRSAVRTAGLVTDTRTIPDDADIEVGSSCFQLHPGLCITEDREILGEALRIAGFIERHFLKSMKSKFYRLSGRSDDSAEVYFQYVYFAHLRKRGHKVQVTHLFAKAKRNGSDLVVETRAPKQFAWLTVWNISKAVCLSRATSLQCCEVSMAHCLARGNNWLTSETFDETRSAHEIEVWPTPPAKPPKIVDPDAFALDKLLKKPSKPKKKTSRPIKIARPVALGPAPPRPPRAPLPLPPLSPGHSSGSTGEESGHETSVEEKAPSDDGPEGPGGGGGEVDPPGPGGGGG